MPNLVGIGNSQVPTNAMLGDLAYQDSIGEINIEKIKAKISDKGGYSANDIFVYDTRKDSDGGAWRHRTQHTSWYNEGVNKGRGARKEFPVVAVLVTYNNGLRIHDGDDPNLPMWMEAWQYQNDSSGSTRWWGGSGTANKVVAINGMIVMGLTLGTRNLHFINDRMSLSYSPASGAYTQVGGVANRNDANTTSGWDRSDQYYTPLRDHTTNDVAITVVPNSMIDVSTGLPNPTFAVATDSGVTVRKSDFTAVDIYRSNDDDVHHVEFDGDRVIMAMELGAVYVATIPDADQSGNPNSAWTVYGTFGANASNHPYILGLSHPNSLAFMKDHTFVSGGTNNSLERYKGLCITSEDINSSTNGMCAFIRKDSNTGWMHGNVKRALLSSTDSTDITGSGYGYVTGNDSTFGAAITSLNWSERSGSSGRWNVSGGKLNTGNPGPYDAGEYLDITLPNYTAGQTHVISYTLSSVSGYKPLRWRYNDGQMGDLPTSNGDHQYYVTLTETGTLFSLLNDNNLVASIDDFRIQLVSDEERSRSNNSTSTRSGGMVAIGTVPKSPVATGAELMAYGPFSTGNGLVQAYDSALDYGTGDFYYMIWVNLSGHSPLQGIWSRQGTYQTSGNRIQVQTVGSGNGEVAIYSGSNQSNFGTNSRLGIGVWHHLAMVRRSGTMYWYKDGVQFSSYSDTTNYTNTTANLRLGGLSYQNNNIFTTVQYPMTQGKLALFRTGSTAPSLNRAPLLS